MVTIPQSQKVKIMGEMVPACFLELEKFLMNITPRPSNKYYPFPVLLHSELTAQMKESDLSIWNEDFENVR